LLITYFLPIRAEIHAVTSGWARISQPFSSRARLSRDVLRSFGIRIGPGGCGPDSSEGRCFAQNLTRGAPCPDSGFLGSYLCSVYSIENRSIKRARFHPYTDSPLVSQRVNLLKRREITYALRSILQYAVTETTKNPKRPVSRDVMISNMHQSSAGHP